MGHLGDSADTKWRWYAGFVTNRGIVFAGLALALAACGNDSAPPPPSAPATATSGQLLVLNGDNSLVRCEAGRDGRLTLCNASWVDELDGPGSIESYGSQVYLSDLADQAVSHCSMGGPQLLQQCHNTSDNSFSSPLGLAVSNQHLYVAQGDNTLAVCELQSNAVGACSVHNAEGLLRNPTGVAATNAAIYIANQHDDAVVICDADEAGQIGSCSRFSGEPGLFDSPTGLAYAASRLYITNVGDDSIVVCATGEERDLHSCHKFRDADNLSTPIDIALNGDLAYVANLSNHTLATCKLDSQGAIASCVAGVADDLFMYPGGLAFAPTAQ